MEQQITVYIDAPPERVWAVMTDVERWPEWTGSVTGVRRLDDRPFEPGFRAKLKQPRVPAMEWRVTEVEPGQAFTWETSAPGSRSVAGHLVTPDGQGGSTVTLRVQHTGIAAALMTPILSRMTTRFLAMEAEGLKARCEAG